MHAGSFFLFVRKLVFTSASTCLAETGSERLFLSGRRGLCRFAEHAVLRFFCFENSFIIICSADFVKKSDSCRENNRAVLLQTMNFFGKILAIKMELWYNNFVCFFACRRERAKTIFISDIVFHGILDF
jgi:hypothetical protein